MTTLSAILDRIAHPRILVLGDLILDRYTFGNAERVSPEAPVVVLRVDAKEVRLGGAASVASLLRGLEAEVTLAGVVGDDSDGRTLRSLLRDEHIDGRLVLIDPQRPTTAKERIIGRAANRHSHQIVRVDHETRDPISGSLEEGLIGAVIRQLSQPAVSREAQPSAMVAAEANSRIHTGAVPGSPNVIPKSDRLTATPGERTMDFDAILISDYAKGVCTPSLVRRLIDIARGCKIPVIVDPARIADYGRYAGATLLKPNRAETELATGQSIGTSKEAVVAAEQLRRQNNLEAVLVTLDSDGMVLVESVEPRNDAPAPGDRPVDSSPSSSFQIPTTAREVYDITGAGDMVLATLGLCIASRVPLPEAAQLANLAAGLEVEKLGVTPIIRAELRAALASSPSPSSFLHPQSSSVTKFITLTEAVQLANSYRAQGKRTVFTNGCFDLLHVGHVTYLQEAAALGDVLIVAVNSDSTVRALKGQDRPIISDQDRARMLASLGCVDHVLVFDFPTPHKLLEQLRPDILVKGGTTVEIIGREVVEAYGGRVVRLAEIPGASTTKIASRLPCALLTTASSNPKSKIPNPR